MEQQNPTLACLCFQRDMTDIDLRDNMAHKYTDVKDGEQDGYAEEMLNKLKEYATTELGRRLKACLVFKQSIKWTSKGVDPTDPDHAAYLKDFSASFVKTMKIRIAQGPKRQKESKPSDRLFLEYVHHAQCAVNKGKHESGRAGTINKILDYIRQEGKKMPLILYGESGCGKSTILASVITRVLHEFGTDTICIFRFIGTSPYSTTHRDILSGVCMQLCEIFNLPPPTSDIVNHTHDLSRFLHLSFEEALKKLKSSQKFVFILDGLDQLPIPELRRAAGMYIPSELPEQISFIVSTTPNHTIYKILKGRNIEESYFMKVGPLGCEQSLETVSKVLELYQRKVTKQQEKAIRNVLTKHQNPLYLRLVHCTHTLSPNIVLFDRAF